MTASVALIVVPAYHRRMSSLKSRRVRSHTTFE